MGECPKCGDIGIEGTRCLDCGCDDYKVVVVGVDFDADLGNVSVFRCACGFECQEAQRMIAHQRTSHRQESHDEASEEKTRLQAIDRTRKATSDKDDYPF